MGSGKRGRLKKRDPSRADETCFFHLSPVRNAPQACAAYIIAPCTFGRQRRINKYMDLAEMAYSVCGGGDLCDGGHGRGHGGQVCLGLSAVFFSVLQELNLITPPPPPHRPPAPRAPLRRFLKATAINNQSCIMAEMSCDHVTQTHTHTQRGC